MTYSPLESSVDAAAEWAVDAAIAEAAAKPKRARKPKAPKRLSPKQIDKLIERIYYANCSGIEINIMDIPKIFKAGQAAYAGAAVEGAAPEQVAAIVRDVIVAYVAAIRKN